MVLDYLYLQYYNTVHIRSEVIVCFIDIGGTVDHHCLKTFFRSEVIACFMDIGETVDHHCLNFL
jgi:hypothetical protein